MNILFVDDEETLLEIFKDEVENSFPEYFVKTACDGEEALKLIGEIKFDFIFTDGKMPKVDGLELAQKLVEQNFCGRIFLVTGHYDDVSQEKLDSVNIEDVFHKPGVIDNILSVIKEN